MARFDASSMGEAGPEVEVLTLAGIVPAFIATAMAFCLKTVTRYVGWITAYAGA